MASSSFVTTVTSSGRGRPRVHGIHPGRASEADPMDPVRTEDQLISEAMRCLRLQKRGSRIVAVLTEAIELPNSQDCRHRGPSPHQLAAPPPVVPARPREGGQGAGAGRAQVLLPGELVGTSSSDAAIAALDFASEFAALSRPTPSSTRLAASLRVTPGVSRKRLGG